MRRYRRVAGRYPKHLRPTLGKRLDDHWITALIIVSKIRYSQPQQRLDYIHEFNEKALLNI